LRGGFTPAFAVAGQKLPRNFVESFEFIAVFENLCLFHNFSRKSEEVLRKSGWESGAEA